MSLNSPSSINPYITMTTITIPYEEDESRKISPALPPVQAAPSAPSVRTIDMSDTLYQPTWTPGESRITPIPSRPNFKTLNLFSSLNAEVDPVGFLSIGGSNGFGARSNGAPGQVGRFETQSAGPRAVRPRVRRELSEPILDVGLEVTKPAISDDKPHKIPKQRLGSAHSRVATANLETRRGDRDKRTKPWTETSSYIPRSSRPKHGESIENHYGSNLPPGTWVKSEPRKYSKNAKWGDRFVSKKNKGRLEKPIEAEWTHDDGYRIWKLQKSGKSKMGIVVDKIVDSEKSKQKKTKDSKGRIKENKENKYMTPVEYTKEKEMYQRYLKEKDERETMDRACNIFQKHVRGWRERTGMQKLQQKVVLESGGLYKTFVKEYKGVMSRIHTRNGTPNVPFTIEMAIGYLERRTFYNNIFNEFAVNDHLPVPVLDEFVEKCGLDVNDDVLEYSFDVVFDGCQSKADVVLLIDLPVSLGDTNFKSQQVLLQDIVECLHISSRQVRIGYIPFKSDVFVGFELGQCKTRESVLKGLDKVRYHEGIKRTDLALRKMRNTFQRVRTDGTEVPRIAIMLSEGGDFQSRLLQRQAKEAREKDNIDIYGIVLGNSAKLGELEAVTGDPSHILRVPHQSAIWGVRHKLMQMAGLKNCRHCTWRPYRKTGLDDGRGLSKTEACELLFQMAPPGSVNPKQESREIQLGAPLRFNDDDELPPEEDGNDALFDPCLRFIIKARLIHNGEMLVPVGGGTGRDVTVSSWQQAMARAEEWADREEALTHLAEEDQKIGGYRGNVIRGTDSDDDDVDDGAIGLTAVDIPDDESDEDGNEADKGKQDNKVKQAYMDDDDDDFKVPRKNPAYMVFDRENRPLTW